MAYAEVTVRIDGWPEFQHAIIARIAAVLREEADADGDPRVARKLREIADRFEAGQ